jgi:hypothetical protein
MAMGENSHEDRRLPANLAGQLPMEIQDALQHPFRRQLLRVLNGGGRRLSAAELSNAGPVPSPISRTSYHLLVLTSSGLLETAGSESSGASRKQFFSSRPDQSDVVMQVLGDTAQSDHHLLASAAEAHV